MNLNKQLLGVLLVVLLGSCASPKNIIYKMGYKALSDRNEEAPLREFLQQVADHTDFKAWYFGHFHKDCKIADSYFCLYDILSLIQR